MSDDVRRLEYYAPHWREFSDDQLRITGSCYGNKIFRRDTAGGLSQWDSAIALLRSDRASRRAVLSISHPLDSAAISSKDVACASLVQMLLRDEKLDLIVFMRSNDAYLGFPYDVFLFTMLQELAAAELGVELGTYFHSAGSLHLYDEHVPIARNLINLPSSGVGMPPLQHTEAMHAFLEVENALRCGLPDASARLECLPSYWKHLAEVLFAFACRKRRCEQSPFFSELSPYRELVGRIG